MPFDAATYISRLRSRLDESTAVFWSDEELMAWINEAAKDIARRTEALRTTDTIAVTIPATVYYNLPADVVRVHRVEFTMDDSTQIYRLQPINVPNADSIGWMNQDATGIPEYFFTWGFSGTLGTPQLYVYPKPSMAGELKVWYYRLPVAADTGDDLIEIPEGWDDVALEYAEYRALLKDGNPRFQIAKQDYESKLNDMYNLTRDLHDSPSYVVPYGLGGTGGPFDDGDWMW